MRVGTICYDTSQGLGRLPKDYYDNGVITDVIVYRHSSRPAAGHYPNAEVFTTRPFNRKRIVQFLKQIDTLLLFETPFDWSYLKLCKLHNVYTVLMPMYEHHPVNPPYKFDKFLCPSLLDMDYFPEGEFIPVPFRTDTWQQRTRARRFLHNGGNLGMRGHKGTLELLKAVEHVKSPFELTVRAQDVSGLNDLLEQVPSVLDDKRVTIQKGEIPYTSLWDDHDVLIAAEKFNGLSLPLQEAYAAGMLVMTTDRFPMNTWLPTEPMIPVAEKHWIHVSGGKPEVEECTIDPVAIAATIDAWYDRDITEFSIRGREHAQANSWEVLKPRILKAITR